MKNHIYTKAFVWSLVIHTIILLLSITTFTPKQPPTPIKEKRFGIDLSEVDMSPIPPSIIPLEKERHKEEKTSQSQSTIPQQSPLEQTPINNQSNNDDFTPYTPDDGKLLPRSIARHYGEEFYSLSAGEQHYLITNLQVIRHINEVVGTRLLRTRENEEIDPKETNIVEFTLHPNGNISNLHLTEERNNSILDTLTLDTITLAHKEYPKPKQDTLIRIRVWILMK